MLSLVPVVTEEAYASYPGLATSATSKLASSMILRHVNGFCESLGITQIDTTFPTREDYINHEPVIEVRYLQYRLSCEAAHTLKQPCELARECRFEARRLLQKVRSLSSPSILYCALFSCVANIFTRPRTTLRTVI